MEHLGLTGLCLDLRTKRMNKAKGSQVRAFIAISLPGSRQVLERIQAELRLKGMKASWTKPGSLHLTLKFLGNLPSNEIEPIQAAMVKTVDPFSRFELSLGRLGVFPDVKAPRILWAGVDGGTDTLEKLFKTLEIHIRALGWKKERQRFLPHITLGRIRKPIFPSRMINLLKDRQIGSHLFEVQGITLFKSELTPSGAIHTPLFQAGINQA